MVKRFVGVFSKERRFTLENSVKSIHELLRVSRWSWVVGVTLYTVHDNNKVLWAVSRVEKVVGEDKVVSEIQKGVDMVSGIGVMDSC